MAGKNQHYIPRSVQRAFEISDGRRNARQIWSFRRAKSFIQSVENSGAEDYFYSRLSSDGSKTVDDRITDHELASFNDDLFALITATPGPVDSDRAAAIVTHLVARGGHLRSVVRAATPLLADLVERLIGSSDQVAALLGLGGAQPTPQFKARMAEIIPDDHPMLQLGLARPVLENLAYMLLRENSRGGFDELVEGVRHLGARLRQSGGSIARDAQTKSLAQSLVPEGRATVLRRLAWRAVDRDAPTFILPDFIGLAFDHDGTSGTMYSFDEASFAGVVMPLSPTRLLIGGDLPATFAPTDFNVLAAPHCADFFISSFRDDKLEALRASIGTATLDPVRAGLDEAARDFRNRIAAASQPAPTLDAGPWRTVAGSVIELQTDFLSEDEGAALLPILTNVLGHARQRFDTDLLARIVSFEDYDHALATLDRGALAEDEPVRASIEGWSAAYNVPVEQDGEARIAMVLRAETIRGLLSNEDVVFGIAATTVLAQLARIGTDHLLGTVFATGIAIGGGDDRLILPSALLAWKDFVVSSVEDQLIHGMTDYRRSQFLDDLATFEVALVAAVRGFWADRDSINLADATIMPAVALLRSAARAAAGIVGDPDRAAVIAFMAKLDAKGLARWFDLLVADLAAIWVQGTSYPSQEAFRVLVRHVERLLALGSIYPWDDGSPFGRIEAPLPPAHTAP